MSIFLDSSQLKTVERFLRMGIIRGVTTNPTIMLKEGVTGGMRGIEERSRAIARMVHPLPVSVEVISNHPEEMISQAREFASWAENINVKITIHGPNGELDNLEAIHKLETVYDIRVNVTAMMSAQQCLLAAMAGATFVSIFGGRVNNMGYDACNEINRLRRVLDQSRLEAKIIVGSTREVLNVIQWIEAGAHIVTVTPNLLEGMMIHPYSKDTVRMFLRDGAEIAAMVADGCKSR
ncbi:transaldolase [Candidatus Parcubacteria bacterium]|nr:MAG: transaldolase [Candidatus Parcubacteria bacterium]